MSLIEKYKEWSARRELKRLEREAPEDPSTAKKKKDDLSEKKSHAVVSKFDKKKEYKKRRMSKLFIEFLDKAGVDKTPKQFNTSILLFDVALLSAFSLFIIIIAIVNGSFISDVFTILLVTWTLVFVALYLISLLLTFVYLDMKISQRTSQIEDVLPDFLQLTAANIGAGMPIDRALWFAVRPHFGVLAKEMEVIAKQTITGSTLEEGLRDFMGKYDSRILHESMNLLIAGINSGGELADLLNNISENIQATKLMQKEISASVMTYVIFIGVASVLAAPLLYALSGQLLDVITGIAGNFSGDGGGAGGSSFSLSFSDDSISKEDFKTFAYVLIIITSYFASAIISTIQTGTSKGALKKFPLYVVVAFLAYIGSAKILGLLLGGLF